MTNDNHADKLLGVSGLAKYLGVSRHKIYAWTLEGMPTAMGKRRFEQALYRISDVEQWFEARRKQIEQNGESAED